MATSPQRSITDEPNLLAAIRDLFSRFPEYRHRDSWELQWLLYALNYTNKLEDEGEITAAVEALRVEGEVLP